MNKDKIKFSSIAEVMCNTLLATTIEQNNIIITDRLLSQDECKLFFNGCINVTEDTKFANLIYDRTKFKSNKYIHMCIYFYDNQYNNIGNIIFKKYTVNYYYITYGVIGSIYKYRYFSFMSKRLKDCVMKLINKLSYTNINQQLFNDANDDRIIIR